VLIQEVQEVQETTWEQVSQLDLRGRPFHREEAGDEIYGTMGEVVVDQRDGFEIFDYTGHKVAGGSMSMGSCRIKTDGTVHISIYMIGSFYIFPYGTTLKPA